MARRVRIKPGDVFEVRTSRGLGYVQYTHEDDRFGPIVSVLKGLHEQRPADLQAVVDLPEQFRTYFVVDEGARRGMVEPVGRYEIPEFRKAFPVFRNGIPDEHGHVAVWWFWDGEREWRTEHTTEEVRDMPLLAMINHARLVECLETGYTHREFPSPPQTAAVQAESPEPAVDGPLQTRFFLYFPKKRGAKKAARDLERDGLQADMEKDDDGWKLVVTTDADGPDVMALDDRLEAVADAHGGEYDGSETSVAEPPPG